MSILRINIVYIFWSKHGCFTSFFDILNTKRLITPERESFRGSNFDRLCSIGNVN